MGIDPKPKGFLLESKINANDYSIRVFHLVLFLSILILYSLGVILGCTHPYKSVNLIMLIKKSVTGMRYLLLTGFA